MTITPAFSWRGGENSQDTAEQHLFLSVSSPALTVHCHKWAIYLEKTFLTKLSFLQTSYFSKKRQFKIFKKVHWRSFLLWGSCSFSGSPPLHMGHLLADSSPRKSCRVSPRSSCSRPAEQLSPVAWTCAIALQLPPWSLLCGFLSILLSGLFFPLQLIKSGNIHCRKFINQYIVDFSEKVKSRLSVTGTVQLACMVHDIWVCPMQTNKYFSNFST